MVRSSDFFHDHPYHCPGGLWVSAHLIGTLSLRCHAPWMFKAGLVFEGRRNGQKWHSQAIPPKRSKEMDPWFHSYYWPHSTGCFWSNFAVGNSSTWPWEMCRLHLPGIEWGQSQELCLGVDRAPRIAAKPITVRCILVSDTMQQKYIYILYIYMNI